MVDFWANQWRELWAENERFIEHINENEWDDERKFNLLLSEILNVQHIWTHRLLHLPPESDRKDEMPRAFWSELNHQNYLHSMEVLKEIDNWQNPKVDEQMNMMQHIIKEVVYLRGCLAMLFQLSHKPILSTKFD